MVDKDYKELVDTKTVHIHANLFSVYLCNRLGYFDRIERYRCVQDSSTSLYICRFSGYQAFVHIDGIWVLAI